MQSSSSTEVGAAALEACGVSKGFPGVRALDNVSLTLERGRVLALLGENGAGKSTLINILSGVLRPDTGTLKVNGAAIELRSPRHARSLGIATIFQELSLAPNLTVAENIYLGREHQTRFGWIRRAELNRQARGLLERLRLDVAPTETVDRLRVGQQQVIEIARALATDAKVLIMDEPTSALSAAETEALLGLVQKLKAGGTSVIYITHKLEELAVICDDVIVMRDGRVVAGTKFGARSLGELVELMVERPPLSVSAKRSVQQVEEIVRADQLSVPHPTRRGQFLLQQAAISAHRGEIVGLFGLMGAGRTELLECLFGIHGPRELWIQGERQTIGSPRAAVAAGIAFAPADRKREGLILGMSIRDNVMLTPVSPMQRFVTRPAQERDLVEALLSRLKVKRTDINQPVRTLSGGNQQKVVLAKWLAIRPSLLLLDEPTRGVDVHARAEIYELMRQNAEDGIALILASSEIEELLAICDRIIVLCEGRISGEFARTDATAEKLMIAALPVHRSQFSP